MLAHSKDPSNSDQHIGTNTFNDFFLAQLETNNESHSNDANFYFNSKELKGIKGFMLLRSHSHKGPAINMRHTLCEHKDTKSWKRDSIAFVVSENNDSEILINTSNSEIIDGETISNKMSFYYFQLLCFHVRKKIQGKVSVASFLTSARSFFSQVGTPPFHFFASFFFLLFLFPNQAVINT